MAYAENQVTLEVVSDGSDGAGVSSIQPQYYLSTSSSSATGGSWSNTLTYESGKYIWTRDEVTLSNGTVTHSTAIYNQALTNANEKSESAITLAEAVDDHFWYDNTGAHITKITQEDYQDDPSSAGGNTLITSDGMAVRDGETELAVFTGNGAQIGQSETAHLDIQSDGLSGYGSDGATYFDFSSSGANVPAEIVYGMPSGIRNATITYSQGRTKQYGSTITITDWGEESGDICTIISSSLSCSALNNDYSFRGTSSHTNCSAVSLSGGFKIVLEPFDITIGTNSTHTATATVILRNNGTNYQFLFEFNYTYVYSNGVSSISYECYVTSESPSSPTLTCKQNYASGRLVREISVVAPYMKFGSRPLDEAAGGYSATLGQNLYGSSNYQTAIGKYNVQDSSDTYPFIIGNGTSDNARSNALTVGWNGNVTASGDITDGSGNTLSTIASATNSKLKNITVKGISKSFYIGAGTSTSPTTKDISFTSTELEGGSIYNAYVCIGTYQLPYFNVANKLFTWVSSVTSNTITISNSATAWGSSSSPYTAYCVLFLTGTT